MRTSAVSRTRSKRNRNDHLPQCVLLIRHGQSAGNVALEQAEAGGHSVIDIEMRDVDVPLSELGIRQAEALGDWFATLPIDERPTVILTSPYLRARQTATIAAARMVDQSTGVEGIEVVFDERLREREFGIVDRLTKKGIIEKFPEQAEIRTRLKKFYYRAPGGESWCDVILRLRSVEDSLSREYAGERVMIVCHTVVILCFRYLFEKLTEDEILEIDREVRLANCSLTSYSPADDVSDGKRSNSRSLKLDTFNFVAPVSDAGEKVTSRPDAKIAPR